VLSIPYVHIPPLRLFGAPIQPFGLLVGLAIVVGFLLARRRAATTGLDPQLCVEGMVWMVLVSLVTGHLVDVVLYYPEDVLRHPLVLLEIWRDLSSFGGFLGGGLTVYLFFSRRGAPTLRYADAIMFGLVPGWIFGRMGCAVAHDHPGAPTSWLLGVRFPDGIIRHDLGFEEMLFAVVLTAVLTSLRSVRPFDGFHTAVVMLLYAPVRFLMDFLRVGDRTYLGLTPAQHLCVVMAAFGVYLVARGARRGRARAI